MNTETLYELVSLYGANQINKIDLTDVPHACVIEAAKLLERDNQPEKADYLRACAHIPPKKPRGRVCGVPGDCKRVKIQRNNRGQRWARIDVEMFDLSPGAEIVVEYTEGAIKLSPGGGE